MLKKKKTGNDDCRELHDMEMKGREITVKWAGEGMWTCLDPACNKKNHEVGFCVLKK